MVEAGGLVVTVPTWWEFLILALAVIYAFYLVSESVVLERPRDWVLNRLDDDKWEAFIVCPWCVGFWLALAAWGAFLVDRTWAVGLAVPLALAAVNGLVHGLRETT
jgi:hypothetical protein